MLPLQGVTLGDIGEKIGLNGLDNGFIMFDHYSIPRTCLLNKYADVTLEGEYVTSIKDQNKHFGKTLLLVKYEWYLKTNAFYFFIKIGF